MENITVSVCCLTYNHAKYIRQALDGFVNQKTNFKYEVLVHDDASTDETASIIKEYEDKYPHIIRGIYQSENQYSKRKGITSNFILPNVRGRYVAMCEGDDFWTNENKLQMQVDALDENPNCHMCVHTTVEIYADGQATGKAYPDFQRNSGIIESRDFLNICRRYSFQTSSYMFRADEWKAYISTPIEFRKACRVGDEAYMLYFGQLAPVYYVSETMSAYRRGVASSWSKAQASNLNIEKIIEHPSAMIKGLTLFDEYTERKYHDIVVLRVAPMKMKVAILTKNAKEMFKRENREYLRVLSFKKKLQLLVGAIFPNMVIKSYLRRLRGLYAKKGY